MNDKLQGLRSKVNTIDEWLSGDIRQNVVAALEQEHQLDDWVILAVSSKAQFREMALAIPSKMELLSIMGANITTHTRRSGITGWTTCHESGDPNMW